MWKIIILTAALLLVSCPAYAEWDTEDGLLFMTRLIDLEQTLKIAKHYNTPVTSTDGLFTCKHPEDVYELNPLLGQHPSEQDVCLYFSALIGLDYFFYKQSQRSESWDKFNYWWKKINLGTELWCISNNYQLRLKYKF